MLILFVLPAIAATIGVVVLGGHSQGTGGAGHNIMQVQVRCRSCHGHWRRYAGAGVGHRHAGSGWGCHCLVSGCGALVGRAFMFVWLAVVPPFLMLCWPSSSSSCEWHKVLDINIVVVYLLIT